MARESVRIVLPPCPLCGGDQELLAVGLEHASVACRNKDCERHDWADRFGVVVETRQDFQASGRG